MREIFVNQDHARVGYYKSLLDEAGIPCFIRNKHTNHSMTSMPSPVFFPALCVVDDADYDEAMQLLGEIHHPADPPDPSDWICPGCNEVIPGSFDSCWQCGGDRPASGGF